MKKEKKYNEEQLERVVVDTVKIVKGIDKDVCDGVRGKYDEYVPESLKKISVCPITEKKKKKAKDHDPDPIHWIGKEFLKSIARKVRKGMDDIF